MSTCLCLARRFAVLVIILALGVSVGYGYGWKKALTAPAETAADAAAGVLAKEADPSIPTDDDMRMFWQAWRLIEDQYPRELPTAHVMMQGAISGLVQSLKDRHSRFLTPEQVKFGAEDAAGRFYGIGATLNLKEGKITVIATLPGTPAAGAGIRSGDLILAVDGSDTADLTLTEAIARIRGDKDTPVKLLIGRKGWRQPREISVVRGEIKIDSVKWKIASRGQKRFAVIAISGFNDDTNVLFAEAVLSALAAKVDGVILDLRDNPGGWAKTAAFVAGAWNPGQVVVEFRSKSGDKEFYTGSEQMDIGDLPTVVLVNKDSASASGIVAGALQDWGKARLIGEKTYGKGSAQVELPLADGSKLHLTTNLWYTPKGRAIEKVGITPDETVKGRARQMERALQWLSAQ